MMRNITIILIVLIIAGCAFSEEYPDEWADLAQSPDERIGSCPAIEGVYQDKLYNRGQPPVCVTVAREYVAFCIEWNYFNRCDHSRNQSAFRKYNSRNTFWT